jgi:hypothetical protein
MLLRLVLILALVFQPMVQPMLAGPVAVACEMHAPIVLASSGDQGACCTVQVVEEPECAFCAMEAADCTDCGRCCPIRTLPTEHRTAPGERRAEEPQDVGEPAPSPARRPLAARDTRSPVPRELRRLRPPLSGRERLVNKSVLTI